MPDTADRKYALTRVEAGDYLLPSNDAGTIWRISTYTDGPSSGLEIPRDREFWGLWKWDGPIGNFVDVKDWDRWGQHAGGFDTRAEAIGVALEASP